MKYFFKKSWWLLLSKGVILVLEISGLIIYLPFIMFIIVGIINILITALILYYAISTYWDEWVHKHGLD